MVKLCNSCKKQMGEEGSVSFKCPECGENEILRCGHCRSIAAKYKCHSCSFEGPN